MARKIDFGFANTSPFLELTDTTLSGIEDAGGVKLNEAERETLADILQQYQRDNTRWSNGPLKSEIVKKLESISEKARGLERDLLELERGHSAVDDFARSAIFLNLRSVKMSEKMALWRLKLFDLIERHPAQGSKQQVFISKLADALDRANELAANKQPAKALLSVTKRRITIAAKSGTLPTELEAEQLWSEWRSVLARELDLNVLLRLQSPAIDVVSQPDWSDHLTQLMSVLSDAADAALEQLDRRLPDEGGGRPKDIYFDKIIRDLHKLFKQAGGKGSYSFTHSSPFAQFASAALSCIVGKPKTDNLEKAIQRALQSAKQRT